MSRGGRTLEQQRAANALERVHGLENERYGNYRSYVERLPAQIVMNGLGQAVAMLYSQTPKSARDEKSEDARAYGYLYDHLQRWLCGDHDAAPYRKKADLMKAITECDQDTYVRAHAEALAYLEWLKKFSRAFLARGKEQ
jgi:CRISPR-associated protein Cmr5